MGAMTVWRARAAKVEERGQPWLAPSSIEMVVRSLVSSPSQTSPHSL
jgi:hypothetical protein